MKLLGLSIENVRLIKAFSMKFGQIGLTQIRGKNQAGKTTILDCIEMLFKGTKSVPKDVVTHGEEKARIIGEVGDYTIQRIIKGEKSTLKVVAKDGKEMKSPQSFLDSVINALTFDPRPFLDKDTKGKKAFLMELLKIDFGTIDEEIKEKSEERVVVGREVKKFGTLPILQKIAEVDVMDIMTAKEEVDKTNASIERGVEKKSALESDIKKYSTEIEELKAKLEVAEKNKANTTKELDVVDKALTKLGDKVDTSEMVKMISNASETNKLASAYVANESKKTEKKEKEKEYDSLTVEIDSLRDKKKQILLDADVPVKGLEIKFDGLYFENIHSENWSDSQAMKISCQLCAAMQPELKAVFIDKGEAYDNEQLKALNDWAIENDIQALITIVDSMDGAKHDGAIYIEDGEVK